jgi:site-specific recombinase XerD
MSKVTIYQQACNRVAGFQQMGENFLRTLVINGKSKSTHENYLRQMAKLAQYCKKSPLELEPVELEEYLYHLMQTGKTTSSQSEFKHLVYGLRKLYLLHGLDAKHICLPSIAHSKALPVVLSHGEVKRLLIAPKHLWERVFYAMAYDTGMRISELVDIRIGDVDLQRKQVHIRQSKFKKDRYVGISAHLARGIHKHLRLNKPKDFLFNHPNRKGIPLSKTGIRLRLKEVVNRAGIQKKVCMHTFRHTFATHQLEAGNNIVSVKEAMGHALLSATLVYLNIARLKANNITGCLDNLYPEKRVSRRQ